MGGDRVPGDKSSLMYNRDSRKNGMPVGKMGSKYESFLGKMGPPP